VLYITTRRPAAQNSQNDLFCILSPIYALFLCRGRTSRELALGLKASLCVERHRTLHESCRKFHVLHRRIGTFTVPTRRQGRKALDIIKTAELDGVTDLVSTMTKEMDWSELTLAWSRLRGARISTSRGGSR
jgi:hypothetical protein